MAQTPALLHADIERRFPDNDEQLITPLAVRNTLHDLVDADQRGPNFRPSGQLSVIYLTKDEAEFRNHPNYATLQGLDPTWFYNGMVCRVDLHPEGFGVEMQLVYDNRPDPKAGLLAFVDGSLTLYGEAQVNGKNPVKWVRKDSPEALSANVALYKAGTNYRGNDLVRWLFGGFENGVDKRKSVVFYSNESGSDIPAPSRPEGDAYWTVFNPPPPATFPFQSVTADELRQLKATAKLVATRMYIVTPRPIPGDPEDRDYPDVYVRALMETELEPTGWLLVGADDKQLVNYDLATDTTTPVQGGGGTFQEITGSPYSNAALAAALAAKVSNETRNAPFLVYSSGTERGYQTLTEAVNSVPNFGGGIIELRRSTSEGFYADRSLTLLGKGFSVGAIGISGGAVVTAICDVYGQVVNVESTLDFTGNITYNNNEENAFALYCYYGSKTRMRGDITHISTNTGSAAALAIGYNANTSLDYEGTINVIGKGRILVNGGARVVQRGRAFSADQGIGGGVGYYDLFATVDLRLSATNSTPVLIRQNAAFYGDQHFTLQPGHALLAPAGQVSIQDGIGSGAYVQVAGSLVANTAPAATVNLVPLTPSASGTHAQPIFVSQDTAAYKLIVRPAENYRYTELEASLNIATITPTAITASMVQPDGSIVISTGAVDRPAGSVGVRARLSGGRAASQWTTNPLPFAAAATSPKPVEGLEFNANGTNNQRLKFSVPASNDWGISVWFKRNVAWSESAYFFDARGFAGYELYLLDSNGVGVTVTPGGSAALPGANLRYLQTGQWIRLFIEGTGAIPTGNLQFFERFTGGEPMLETELSDLRFYVRHFTDAEKADSTSASTDGLVRRYALESTSTGSVAQDLSGSNVNGTLTGF